MMRMSFASSRIVSTPPPPPPALALDWPSADTDGLMAIIYLLNAASIAAAAADAAMAATSDENQK